MSTDDVRALMQPQLDPEVQQRLELRRLFEETYWQTHDNACHNCGGDRRLSLRYIVPLEGAGELVESNVRIVCRTCVLDAQRSALRKDAEEDRRPINFWLDRALHARLQDYCTRGEFSSVTALIRALMENFLQTPASYDDLANWVHEGADVKVTAWVDRDKYEQFKASVTAQDLTVTAGLKSLLLIYDQQLNERTSEGHTS